MPFNRALRVGLIYLAISVLWIVFSDRILAGLPVSDALEASIQTVKGLAFVTLSAVLVTLLAWRELVGDRELERAGARQRQLFDTTPIPMWVFDRETLRFLEVNQAAIDHYGWSREEFLTMDLTEIRPPADLPDLARSVDETPATGFHDAGIFRHRTRGGEVILVQVTSHRVDFDGRDAEVVVAIDVTARMEMEAQLRQAQRMESVGRLAGGVAHDFNNLLTVIGNLAALAREDEGPEGPHADTFRQIEAAQQRGAALTRQLLTFSRDAPNAPGRCDAAAVLGRMARMLRPLLGERIELELTVPDQAVPVPLSDVHLEQVLMNLAVNARDAMPDGGRLEVVLKSPEGPERGGSVLRVRDTGMGMSPEIQRRIFEPFYTTKPVGEGTGLGLSTTFGLVTGAGGTLAVDSHPGAGTTFEVTFPADDPSRDAGASRGDDDPDAGASDAAPGSVGNRRAAPPPEPVDAPAPRGSTATDRPADGSDRRGDTVLVVEDEPALRAVMEKALERSGFRVLTADDGREALELLTRPETEVDLVVSDLVMPGMDGTEFLARAREIRPALASILVSGYTGPDAVDGRRLPEDQEFLAKPFTLGELTRAVEGRLRRTRSGAARPRGAGGPD